MSRLMSVALTESAVRNRTKTVTRRLGWWLDKNGRHLVAVGDTLTLCRKVMGRKQADGTVLPLVRIAEVVVVDISREPLNHIYPAECDREGLGHMSEPEFIKFFCDSHKGCRPDTEITRIEWEYLDMYNDVAATS